MTGVDKSKGIRYLAAVAAVAAQGMRGCTGTKRVKPTAVVQGLMGKKSNSGDGAANRHRLRKDGGGAATATAVLSCGCHYQERKGRTRGKRALSSGYTETEEL